MSDREQLKLEANRYILAGNRQGWNFAGLKRIDCPPNKGGFCYTEFRDGEGAIKAVVLTALLAA